MEGRKEIRLSEAIRLAVEDGMVQQYNTLCNVDDEGNIIACCAIGAAEYGYAKINGIRPVMRYWAIREHFPEITEFREEAICDLTGEVRDIIICLNDTKYRSFEEIADCLEAAGL